MQCIAPVLFNTGPGFIICNSVTGRSQRGGKMAEPNIGGFPTPGIKSRLSFGVEYFVMNDHDSK